MSEQPTSGKKGLWVTIGLVGAIVVVFLISFLIGGQGAPHENFAGTDTQASDLIESNGYRPWFSSLFKPGSPEIESGLFALQAALGAGVLGYVIGWFRAKHKFSQEK